MVGKLVDKGQEEGQFHPSGAIRRGDIQETRRVAKVVWDAEGMNVAYW